MYWRTVWTVPGESGSGDIVVVVVEEGMRG